MQIGDTVEARTIQGQIRPCRVVDIHSRFVTLEFSTEIGKYKESFPIMPDHPPIPNDPPVTIVPQKYKKQANKRPYTPEEDVQIMRAIRGEISLHKASKIIGRSYGGAQYRMYAMLKRIAKSNPPPT